MPTAESWTLIISLLFLQQESGTPARMETQPPYKDFPSQSLCETARDALVSAYENEAVEPTTDYEAPAKEPDKAQPVEDQFQLMRPIGVCFQAR